MSRGRLAAQLLTEALLLALLGGAAGLLVAQWAGTALRRTLLRDVAWPGDVVEARLLAYTGVAVLGTTLLTGLVPLLPLAASARAAGLAHAARARGTRAHSTLRTTLLVTQAALCALLLVGAGLFVRSLYNVRARPLGFDPERLFAVRVNARALGLSPLDEAALYDRVRARLDETPGVERTAIANYDPLSAPEVPPIAPGGALTAAAAYDVRRSTVTPGSVATLGARLLRGRDLAESDRDTVPRAVLVSETMARRVWPGRDPLGACFKVSDAAPCAPVVGVVSDVAPDFVHPRPTMQYYTPYRVDPRASTIRVLLVRGDAERLVPAVRRAVLDVAPDLSFVAITPLGRLASPEVRPWRLGATLFSAVGLLALAIAAVGLGAVLSYDVAQRARELGVRLALGAPPARLLADVTRRGVSLAALGVGIGAGVALGGAPLVGPLLLGVSPRDPLVFAGVAAALLGVAFVASFGPARRAARVDPVVALRAE